MAKSAKAIKTWLVVEADAPFSLKPVKGKKTSTLRIGRLIESILFILDPFCLHFYYGFFLFVYLTPKCPL